MVSRMASHKGFDLVLSIFDEMMQDDVQFILLGTGEAQYETFFAEAAKRYPGKALARTIDSAVLNESPYNNNTTLLTLVSDNNIRH